MQSRNVYARLILPLGLALLAAMIAVWAIAIHLLTATIERRLDNQLEHATDILAAGEFPFSMELLNRLDRLIEARIVLLDEQHAVALATGGPDMLASLQAIATSIGDDRPGSLMTRKQDGTTWRIALRALDADRDSRYAYVVAIASLDEHQEATREAGMLLGIAVILVTLLLLWVGHRFTGLTQQSRLAGLGELASRVAHEIRNPLTAIKMQLQILEEKSGREDTERIQRLQSEIRRMEALVESALTIGAPMELRLARVRPQLLIRNLAELLRPSLAHRGIELLTPGDADPEIDADPDRLTQTLLNLVNNAADELTDGGVIELSIGLSENGEHCEIYVEDSGPGMRNPEAVRPSKKAFGLGLGLTICREIVGRHGGTMAVSTSDKLGGARFKLCLPVRIISPKQESS